MQAVKPPDHVATARTSCKQGGGGWVAVWTPNKGEQLTDLGAYYQYTLTLLPSLPTLMELSGELRSMKSSFTIGLYNEGGIRMKAEMAYPVSLYPIAWLK